MPSNVKHNAIHLPNILLPKKNIDLSKWAVVACDQFTSQPSYWKELKRYIEDDPSTYNMILPEVFLEDMNDETIQKINDMMYQYLKDQIFEDIGPSMMLVERTTTLNTVRLGIMMAIDLEAYDYHEGTKPLIRTTEKTIVERIPPRVKIRKQAPLELSHVMLLMDDHKYNIIENLYKNKDQFIKRYDFVLNMLGGHIRGYQIKNCDEVINQFNQLIENEDDPMLFVVGDGNHSLATAKAHWEDIKKDLTEEEQINHPARYSLVEVVNIYDKGLSFEGIHRVLFNVENNFLLDMFHAVDKEEETWIYTKESGKVPFFIPRSTAVAYEQIQSYIDDYLIKHPEVTIDYIHGDEELIEICNTHKKSIGIRMPKLEEKDLFPFILSGKVLPRKSFSMGNATAKRYYLESKLIRRLDQETKGDL
ncbi:DUF1015 domain-containing protein [Peloplasma aerotolerans]|jgi:uncharacterized protein (DUF1015 family)|uniref:DUF1015 domain-containing protein n=1 Tax=Peloplasma aerotolerans TaxID=3044389 RepID=A0AAW6U5R3_9MOLU|nr:DUF1015 domain-containing protein [Mariniplasma sp. M4Ah]MDI6453323.1 DUF1015 domain-containing protein [Mariniplasma sp. M4Ah]